MQGNVYHCSKHQGLKYLEPRSSTHKKSWVYATKDIATSAPFLGENFDFICQIMIDNKVPTIYEQFMGAFDQAYKGYKGSIYVLDGKNFKENQTDWNAEVVSEFVEPVLEEIEIEDVEDYLRMLESKGKLKILLFPEKPLGCPTDKSDIVQKGIDWTIDTGESTLNRVELYHPDVLERVILGLKDKRYKFVEPKWQEFAANINY